jgi:hypothetical protein
MVQELDLLVELAATSFAASPWHIIYSMRRYSLVLMTFLCLLALAAQATDVSGQWLAQIPGRSGNTLETTFNFKVSGQQLTGTMENQYGERQISDGKISGGDISFTVHIDMGGNEVIFLYNGKVSGDEIKFTREVKGGEFGPAKVDFVAKRKK